MTHNNNVSIADTEIADEVTNQRIFKPDCGDNVWLLLQHERGEGQLVQFVQRADALVRGGPLQVQGGLHCDVEIHQPLLDLQPPQFTFPIIYTL